MDTTDFLSAVLPTQGKYCNFIQKDKLKKNIFLDSLDNLYDTAVKHSDQGKQSFYALSTFDDAGTRVAAHALYVKSIFIDMDCGVDATTGKPKAFASKREAVTALVKFLDDSGLGALGTPWLVDSGGGVHAYWPYTEEVPVAQWKPVAEAFKRAAAALQFKIDMTVTADAARVLRNPGTLNHKYDPPRPVVLKQRGDLFEFSDIEEVLAAYKIAVRKISTDVALLGARPSFAALSPIAKAMAGNSITLFGNIAKRTAKGTGCQQLQYYFDHADEDGMEPIWRGWLSIAKHCDDGDRACKKLSALHPYEEERMYMKLNEIKGPYPCTKLESENPGGCEGCAHKGKITNPLALGRQVETTTESVIYETPGETEDEPSVEYARPTPPWGYSYGKNGGLFYKKAGKPDEEPVDVMLVPYDLFMTKLVRDETERHAEFKVIKGTNVFTFAVPLEKATNVAECTKLLAANGVVASVRGYDVYLADFVRQSIMSATVSGSETVVPPRFGWVDGDFAVGDTVYSQHGQAHDYSFVSNRLHNIIDLTKTAGTIENWRKPFQLMLKKKMWGHLAMGGMGFASVLMHFMPPGSRAVCAHVCGTHSGLGKSYALALASSIWGSTHKYNVPATTSLTTLMQRAGLLGALPLVVDEITAKQRESDREFVPNLVFNYSNGAHKVKGSATGNNEIINDLFWEALMLFSSNTPALEAMMGARIATSEGEARRMLEWVIPKHFRFEWADEQEREESKLLETNYGIAGRMFVQYCVMHQDEIAKICNEALIEWRRVSGATDDERFWSSGIGANIAGWIIARRAGIIDIPLSGIINFWLEDVISPARVIISSNQRSALDILNSYIRENNNNFVTVEGSIVMQNLNGNKYAVTPDSQRRIVRGRIERNMIPGVEDIYLETKMVKTHCANMNFGFQAFMSELDAHAQVREGRKNLLAGTNGPNMRVDCVRITRTLTGGKPTNSLP
jgi:hypothetical protein